MGHRKRLREALANQRLVRIDRSPKHANRLDGFVIGIGEKWVLLAATTQGGYFDGHLAFRLKDIDRIRRAPRFMGRFARTQPEWPPTTPTVDLDSTVGVLTSLAASSRLIGIEKANERSALWIGIPVKIGPRWTWLHEVNADGSWNKQPLGYKTRRITDIHAGGLYLRALEQAADGRPNLGL